MPKTAHMSSFPLILCAWFILLLIYTYNSAQGTLTVSLIVQGITLCITLCSKEHLTVLLTPGAKELSPPSHYIQSNTDRLIILRAKDHSPSYSAYLSMKLTLSHHMHSTLIPITSRGTLIPITSRAMAHSFLSPHVQWHTHSYHPTCNGTLTF